MEDDRERVAEREAADPERDRSGRVLIDQGPAEEVVGVGRPCPCYRLLVDRIADRTGGTLGSLPRCMKLLYKPFGLILGIIGGLLGKQLFDFVWTKLDDEEPPEATTREATLAARCSPPPRSRASSFKLTRAAVDRYGAKGWYYLTGSWPGEKRPDPDE